MRTRPGNDSFSLPVLKAEPTPASFHHPSCQVPEDANDHVDLFAIGGRAFLCFQSKRLINQKMPISDHISNPEFIVWKKQNSKFVPVESSCDS